MNTRGNQRFRATENRIREVFYALLMERGPESVTVQDICRLAGINRSTFYIHHEDILALLDALETDMALYLIRMVEESSPRNVGEVMLLMFRLVRDNQAFCRAYWTRTGASRVLEQALDLALPDGRKEEFLREIGFTDPEEYNYHIAFFKSGLSGLVRRWLDRDCRETPEEMAAILHKQYHLCTDPFEWKQ